jgi:hypothetical protein
MRPLQRTKPSLSSEIRSKIEARWQKALEFYKKRGSVIFVNDRSRFWESHGFAQQSLAKV